MKKTAKPATTASQNTLRSFLSLAIFVHLFIVALVLVGNVRRSRLERRFWEVFAPYTESLGFVVPWSVHYYTHGETPDDDHFIEVEVVGQKTNVQLFPSPGSNWSAERRRGFRLTKQLGTLAEAQDDNLAAEFARNFALPLMGQPGVEKVVVRCKRRLTQPLHLEDLLPIYPRENATHAAYDRVVYEADIYRDEDGSVQVAKRSSTLEVAPRQPGN